MKVTRLNCNVNLQGISLVCACGAPYEFPENDDSAENI